MLEIPKKATFYHMWQTYWKNVHNRGYIWLRVKQWRFWWSLNLFVCLLVFLLYASFKSLSTTLRIALFS